MVIKYLLLLFLSSVCFAESPVVNTKTGTVFGYEEIVLGKKVDSYLGIPYAEKPIGPLRFRQTVPVKPWQEPIEADHFQHGCAQTFPVPYPWDDDLPGKSEDCLYLNVWVPEGASSSSPKPVMMWIYGGNYKTGSSRIPTYVGNVLAAEGDVVVVSLNYRLGMFGFLSTNTEDAPGNMGLFDVLTALKWVKENIQAFGGDGENITLFGQSAGGYTQAYFTVSPLTKGLFRRVTMESGVQYPQITAGVDPVVSNIRLGQEVAEILNCASNDITMENSPVVVVNCLRTKDTNDILNAESSVRQSFLPIYGDEFMPKALFAALKDGDAHDVEVLSGNVQDEGSVFITESATKVFGPYGFKDTLINKTFAKYLIVSNFYGYERADEIADYYLRYVPEGPSALARRQAFWAYGDFFFLCPLVYFAEILSDQQHDVFYYYYDHQSKNTVFAPWMGVVHTAEIPFVFGRPLDTANYTKEEADFSRKIMKYWTNYAYNGFPSETWKKFSTKNGDRPYIELLRIDENYPVYAPEQLNDCEYLRQYYNF